MIIERLFSVNNKPFQMTIDDVFSIMDRGTIVTGKVESGVLHVYDEVE